MVRGKEAHTLLSAFTHLTHFTHLTLLRSYVLALVPPDGVFSAGQRNQG